MKYFKEGSAPHMSKELSLAAYNAGPHNAKNWIQRFQPATMAFLVGLMLGSIRKVWPFRKILEERLVGSKVIVLQDECILPSSMTNEVWTTIIVSFLGFGLVFLLERLGKRQLS